MSRHAGPQRICEAQRWEPMAFIMDTCDLAVPVKKEYRGKPILDSVEINAASNATIILARMVRKGKMAGQ